MMRHKWPSSLVSALALLFVMTPGCGDGGDGGDGGNNNGQGCPGNTNVDATSATDLPEGTPATGYLCPVRNQHWYRITVPDGHPLVAVDLHNNTPLTAVRLTYTLRQSDPLMMPVDQPPPPMAPKGQQSVRFTHCVPTTGTTYFIQVQSYGDDAQDTRNPFTLSYTTLQNPDPNEPANNGPDGAVALTGADQTGSIACKGDRDFFKITLPDSTLLDISLTTAAATPDLNLKYTLVDGQMRFIISNAVPNGRTPTRLLGAEATPGAGTYYLIIGDQADTGSDAHTPYILKVRSFAEPDGNDRPTRNDTPATSTPLGSWACGGGASFGKSAYLASRADVDWYKLTLSGVSPACPAVVDVNASWGGGGQTLRPQVVLVYPDMTSPCTKNDDCLFLSRGCGNNNDCEYLGNQCDNAAHKCTGSSLCLPEKVCGAVQFAKQQDSAVGTGASIRTAQPLVAAGTYYIAVRDFMGQSYDFQSPYNLAIRLDQDVSEPDNFYTPYDFQSDLNLMKTRAKKIVLGTAYTSKIGYERDRDYYVLDHPCPMADCTLSVTYGTSGPSPVYFTYQVQVADGGKLVAGWPAEPMTRLASNPRVTDTVFGGLGGSDCFYASKRFAGPYYFWVSDLLKGGGPKWDIGTTYSFTVNKVMDGCSTLCKQAPFNCGT